MASKILVGDEVEVIRGKDRGLRGRVRQHDAGDGVVIVDGVNIVRKHVPRQANIRQGGIIETEAPLNKSKVMVICPSCDLPVRVGFRINDEGEKERYCHQCDAVIPRPEVA